MLNETNRLGGYDATETSAPEAPGAVAHVERRLSTIAMMLSHTVENSENLRTRLFGPEPTEVTAANVGQSAGQKGAPGQMFALDRMLDELESLARRARNAANRLQEGL